MRQAGRFLIRTEDPQSAGLGLNLSLPFVQPAAFGGCGKNPISFPCRQPDRDEEILSRSTLVAHREVRDGDKFKAK